MRVMVMVKATTNSEAGEMPSAKLMADMGAFNQKLIEAGIMTDGAGLKPTSKGARVAFFDDRNPRILRDGGLRLIAGRTGRRPRLAALGFGRTPGSTGNRTPATVPAMTTHFEFKRSRVEPRRSPRA